MEKDSFPFLLFSTLISISPFSLPSYYKLLLCLIKKQKNIWLTLITSYIHVYPKLSYYSK